MLFSYICFSSKKREAKITKSKDSWIMKYLGSILLFCLVLIAFSCEKPEDTIAKITVVDIMGIGVDSAEVRLFGDSDGTSTTIGDIRIDVTEKTNAAGDAVFDFTEFYEEGQAGLFVLNIEVTKDSLFTESIIKVEPEMLNEETVILQ